MGRASGKGANEGRIVIPQFKSVVLVVDDTIMNRQVASSILRDQFQALVVRDGQTALDLLAKRDDIGLILLDIMTPGLSAFEVCQTLKENPKTAAIPVIFITALSGPEDEKRGFEVGGVDFINKPFQPDTLRARVANG